MRWQKSLFIKQALIRLYIWVLYIQPLANVVKPPVWFQDKAPPTDLVRQFVTEHRYGGADAARHGGGECRADGQAVTEVVDPVP